MYVRSTFLLYNFNCTAELEQKVDDVYQTSSYDIWGPFATLRDLCEATVRNT